MGKLSTFINSHFRPDVLGGRLDKEHKTRFMLEHNNNLVTACVNALCFGPKKDNVLINLEHAVDKVYDICIFYYEDIHQRWTYVNNDNACYFIYKKNDEEELILKPKTLYIRGCYIEPEDNYWRLLGDFFNFVELWPGPVLCSPKKQIPNESKLFQVNNSLKRATKHTNSISLGKSYVIKGTKSYDSLNKDKSYIIKSLSGVRSIVVDEVNYKSWDINHINNVPVLFQEKVQGNDLRVHIINKKLFGKRSSSKDNIDYRYDKNFFKLDDVQNLDEELANCCISISFEEDNQLLGIDFIQTSAGYVVLEANPSPGWSAYHPYNGIDNEPFIDELLKVLRCA